MSAIGVIAFVPATPALYPTGDQVSAVIDSLRAVAEVRSHTVLESGARETELYPMRREVEIARTVFRDRTEYVPFDIRVVRHDQEHEVTEPDSQRYCGACSELIPSQAVCTRCGLDEDPSEWTMGPPRPLYSAAFELEIVFQGGPDIWQATDAHVEKELRQYLGGAVEAAESILGSTLRMVRYVVP